MIIDINYAFHMLRQQQIHFFAELAFLCCKQIQPGRSDCFFFFFRKNDFLIKVLAKNGSKVLVIFEGEFDFRMPTSHSRL